MADSIKRIAFVSTRISGSDGVSLEISKWAEVLERMGHECFYIAVYFKKPILCNRYSIYRTDIEPCGFDVILMDGFLTDEVIGQVREVANDAVRRRRMVEHNFDIARRFFSYDRVEDELLAILHKPKLALTYAL